MHAQKLTLHTYMRVYVANTLELLESIHVCAPLIGWSASHQYVMHINGYYINVITLTLVFSNTAQTYRFFNLMQFTYCNACCIDVTLVMVQH